MLIQALSTIRMITQYLYEHHPELFANGMLTLHNEWGDDWVLCSEGYIMGGPHHPPRILEAITAVYARVWAPSVRVRQEEHPIAAE